MIPLGNARQRVRPSDAPAAFDPRGELPPGVMLVEASAGTGKTHSITAMLARLVADLDIPLNRILVVTYTEAAAGELRDRARCRLATGLGALEAQLAGLPAGTDELFMEMIASAKDRPGVELRARRLRAALEGFDEASITTIHGFCRRMLQQNVFASGGDFGAEIATDLGPFLEEIAADGWTRELHDAPPNFLELLEQTGIAPQTFRQIALATASRPDLEIRPSLILPNQRPWEHDTPEASLAAFKLRFAFWGRRELEARKRAQGRISFDDLLLRLRDSLRDHPRLGNRLRELFSAALIDEFQDTDPVQWEIFQHIFAAEGLRLYLVGDPKQAIYAFRGGDIHAYKQALTACAQKRTLGVNFRSDAAYLAALDHVFTGSQAAPLPFADEHIHYRSCGAHHKTARFTLPGWSPLTLRFLPREQDSVSKAKKEYKLNPAIAPINKGWVQDRLPGIAAGDIAELLNSGAQIADGPGGWRALSPADIAVLVLTNRQAAAMKEALARAGIPAVVYAQQSVLDSAEAQEIFRAMQAALDPGDVKLARAALATRLMGLSAPEILALEEGGTAWEFWNSRLREWGRLWEERGFIQLFQRVLADGRTRERVLAWDDGERRMTNYQHSAEILQLAARERGLHREGLLAWFAAEQASAAAGGADERLLRLETDEAALNIVTVHRSKGLDYPLVWCPFLWDAHLDPKGAEAGLLCRDQKSQQRYYHIGGPGTAGWDEASATYRRERHEESLRLLYVALTRAKHGAVLYWGAISGAGESALAWLLHGGGAEEGSGYPEVAARFSGLNDVDLLAELEAISKSSPAREGVPTIVVSRIESGKKLARWRGRPAPVGKLGARVYDRRLPLDHWWRRSSFSALCGSSPAYQPGEEPTDGSGWDEAQPRARSEESPPETPRQTLSLLTAFPKGAGPGVVLHAILEKCDFRKAAGLEELVATELKSAGFDTGLAGPTTAALNEILASPLPPTGLRLRELEPRRRKSELAFDFPILPDSPHGTAITPARLAAVFQRHWGGRRPEDWPRRLAKLGFAPLRGFLGGSLDLAFEHGGLWYIVDWKSNHLGDAIEDYGADPLAEAMAEHHYFLQYHLYALALHRFLTVRQSGYTYAEHFGGIYYLFLRGMAPASNPPLGIYHDRPDPELIAELDALFRGEKKTGPSD